MSTAPGKPSASSDIEKALREAQESAMRRVDATEIEGEWRRKTRVAAACLLGSMLLGLLFPPALPVFGVVLVCAVARNIWATPRHEEAVWSYKWIASHKDPEVLRLSALLERAREAERDEHRRVRAEEREQWRRQYREYLASAAWKRTRGKVLRAAEHTCERCGGQATQVHHKSYSRRMGRGEFGHEHRANLQALCAKCHADIHGKL